MNIHFRKEIQKKDLQKVREICDSTRFFRADETDVAVELVSEALQKGQKASGYSFIFAMEENQTCGFVCFGSTPCTVGTYDLYWIVVDDHFRGKGIGLKLLQQTENALRESKARKLYIETSSTEKYLPTRKFYLKAGYTEEACLKDFYLPGDHKMIYARNLDQDK